MKALVLEEYMRLHYRDVPVPEYGAEDVLIKVAACGICGSDIHGIDGSTGRRRPPIVMGHEASGVIEAVGSGVRGWKPGDRVTFDSTVYCGRCWYCLRGDINLCDNRTVLGVSCAEYRRHGAFAEYVAVPARILYQLPDTVAFEQAALTEALSIALHAVNRTAPLIGDSVAVVGAGMIGLLAIQCLRIAGAGRIIAVDIEEERLALALGLGASDAVNSRKTDAVEEVKNLTRGRGVDCSMEVVGIEASTAAALTMVRKGGRLTVVGNMHPSFPFAMQQVVTREITILGSTASRGEYPACLDLIAGGRVHTASILSAVAPLSEGAEWFRRLYEQERGLMKVVLRPA